MFRKKILVVEDHPLMADALVTLVGAVQPDFQAVLARTGADALTQIQSDPAAWALALCDLQLGAEDGLSLVGTIKNNFGIPIVILTGLEDPVTLEASKRIGADAFVRKSADTDTLRATLKAVLEGRTVSQEQEPLGLPSFFFRLTDRQKNVLDLMIAGLGNRAISDELNIKESSVRNILTDVYAIFGMSGERRPALMAELAKLGYKPTRKPSNLIKGSNDK